MRGLSYFRRVQRYADLFRCPTCGADLVPTPSGYMACAKGFGHGKLLGRAVLAERVNERIEQLKQRGYRRVAQPVKVVG